MKEKFMPTYILLVILLLAHAGIVLAHGNVHERIHQLDRQIALHPKDVDLLIKRGQLLLDESHAEEANNDFIKANKLAPKRTEVLFHLARTQLMLHQFDTALASAKDFLQQVTNNAAKVRGLVLSGDILSASAKPSEAAEAYLEAIHLSQEVIPDHVLYAANALHKAGKTDKTIAVLDDGIARLGPLQTLNDLAISLELEQKLYEPALHRVNQMLATRQRVPFLLYKKGVIFKLLMRTSEAKETFSLALKEIEKLPEARQHTQAIEHLKAAVLAEIN